MNKINPIIAASLAAFVSLAACNSEPQVVDTNPDPMKEELAKAAPVTLPPAIKSSKTYRCKDNSLVYVTLLADDVTAMVRDKQEEPPVANLKAPAAAQGLTRLTWDLLPTKDVLTQYGGVDAKRLPPSGDYTAELTFGKTKVKQTFRVNVPEGLKTR